MDYKQLEHLNKKFAEESLEMMSEYVKLFDKWLKKSPRTAMVIMMQLPINILAQTIEKDSENLHSKCFPELPDMMYRFMSPFYILRERWGKISDKEFMHEYQKIYESQFNDWFPDEKQKETFKKWFESQKK